MTRIIREDFFSGLDNTIIGNNLDEELRGGGGNDRLAGGGGDDWVRGGDDNDKLFGDDGNDTVDGDAGNDWLTGGSGSDTLNGGTGSDRLFFSGDDAYNGGGGFDVFDARTLSYIGIEGGGGFSMTTNISDTVGIRVQIGFGVAQARDTGSAASEDHYVDGNDSGVVLGGNATFSSIEQYDLTDFGDYFEGDSSASTINGFDGDDVIEGKGGADVINGGSGRDTVEYGSSAGAVNVDLELGRGLMNDAEGDSYTSIENICGSAFVDALYGDDGVNKIMGRGGNDFIEGRGGADTIIGGSGIDRAMYDSSSAGVDVDLTRASQFGGDAQGDTLTGIEDVSGSSFGDTLHGDSRANTLEGLGGSDTIDAGNGNDIVKGGTGDDIIDAGFGNDTIDGGDGIDWLNYHVADTFGTADIASIDLATGIANRFVVSNGVKLLVEADGITGIENVNGSSMSESIFGDVNANHIYGHGGNDTIDGGYGNDVLGGDGGINTVSFASWTAGVSDNIDLSTGIATRTATTLGVGGFVTGVVETDQLFGFQNVTGSSLADTITGDSGANVLDGRLGNDSLDGGLGLDTLIGGAGFDSLKGGDGSDTFKFFAAGDMPVTDFASGHAVVRLEQIVDFQDAGTNQDMIDFSNIHTFNGGHLFLDNHNGVSFELGEVMTLTNGDGHSFISADVSGDGVVDFAVSFDRLMTTLDNSDFLF